MQVAWGQSARALIDRALALAVERGARVTTLHLAAAVMEEGGDGAQLLAARGLRPQDLRTAAKVHPEEPGTFERIQSAAKRIAAARASETSSAHLLAAALGDRRSALAAMLAQLGCDPGRVADDALRTGSRTNLPPVASSRAIIHAGNAPSSSGSAQGRGAGPHHGGASTPPQHGAPPRANHGARNPVINAPGGRESSPPERPRAQLASQPAPAGRAAHGNAQPASQGASPSVNPPGHHRGGRNAHPSPARTEHDFDPRTFPAMALLARNLSADGVRGTLDPVVGRERELRRVLDAIHRRDGRGAMIVGPAGVGKSTVLRALAREVGRGRTVLSLRHAEIVAQARSNAGAERVRRLVEELLAASDRVVVALDPIAPWFLTRDAPDEVVLELRAALAGGRLSWVGTASAEEARRLADAEGWLERAAVRVDLEEPAGPELREIVRAFAPAITAHHGVVADAPVLERAAELSERYLGGRAQPDRALSVIDLALARARRRGLPALARDAVAEVVAEIGGLPLERVAATDGERLLALESHLAERVVGHSHALARVAQTLRRNAVGFRGPRPIGTFLFLGPTGVGKTETAKAIAEALFPGAGAMTRFDMAEFAEAHAVARLVGAPPGYVGYQDGGQLTEAVRRRPYQLVLLDEIEKAHRDVLEALLALLDEGRMTDGRGRTVDFRNTVVVMTSNLGAELYDRANINAPAPARAIGFNARAAEGDGGAAAARTLAERVLDAARGAMPPELWNRIDDPIVFAALTRGDVTEIARRLLAQTFARLEREQGVRAEVGAGVIDLLLDNGGFEPALGARPMRRAIARLVEGPIAEAVLKGALTRGDTAVLEARDWGIDVVTRRDTSA